MTFITPAPDVLPGTIVPYGGAAAPTGYLLCDGSAVSRTTYAALFAIIAGTYGVGDGSTTFNVPNLVGNVPVGIGGSGVTNRGDIGGEQAHTLIASEMPAHTHTVDIHNADTGSGYIDRSGSGFSSTATSSSAGGGGSHQNMQPYVGTEYIIKT